MCGIIGYVGSRACQAVLLKGSGGWSTAAMTRPESRGARTAPRGSTRSVGNLDALQAALAGAGGSASASPTATTAPISVGIGHTRWATHGGVTESNAHPHHDASGRFKIVLNGIIENHVELRARLAADLVKFTSDTDAEVVAHLIALNYAGDLADAVRRSLDELDRSLRVGRHVRRRARHAGRRQARVPAGRRTRGR